MTEAEFQAKVLDLARIGGWMAHHARPARTTTGWRTPIQGDPGFPDLVLAHPKLGVVFAELKSERGRTTPAQDAWLLTLVQAGRAMLGSRVRVFAWRPRDWHQIVSILTPGATP